jgi:hypothetical protein
MARKNLARANLSNDVQLARRIAGAHGESIPNRPGQCRIIAVGLRILCQYAPRRAVEPDVFHSRESPRGCYVIDHAGASVLKGERRHKVLHYSFC